jgi:hypothetical protein
LTGFRSVPVEQYGLSPLLDNTGRKFPLCCRREREGRLFLVERYREELAKKKQREQALGYKVGEAKKS